MYAIWTHFPVEIREQVAAQSWTPWRDLVRRGDHPDLGELIESDSVWPRMPLVDDETFLAMAPWRREESLCCPVGYALIQTVARKPSCFVGKVPRVPTEMVSAAVRRILGQCGGVSVGADTIADQLMAFYKDFDRGRIDNLREALGLEDRPDETAAAPLDRPAAQESSGT